MPKLSIIIPVYNAEKYLCKCVDSILNQTTSQWELVLVNDGSKDSSLAICRAYAGKDSRVKVIDKENGGAGPARNAGLEVVSGEYVTFVDSDDWLEEDSCDFLMNKAQETNADIIVFGMRTHICDSDGGIINVKEDQTRSFQVLTKEEFREKWASLYKSLNMDSCCNKIYKTAMLKQNLVKFPDLRRMQDGVFNMYCYKHINSFVVLSENFYNRRWNYVDTQRKKMPANLLECALAYYKQEMELLQSWAQDTKENKRIVVARFVELIHTVEFHYMPYEKSSFKDIYWHIRKINNNPCVHSILKEFKQLNGKIRKKEWAMLHKCNLLLAITYCKNNRKR